MSIYEEVEIEDLDYDPVLLVYTYPCPCGDKFSISLESLWDGEDIALCPSCTLRIEVIYDEEDLPPLPEGYDDESESDEEDSDDTSESGEEKEGSDGDEEKKDDDDRDLAAAAEKSLAVKK